MIGSYRVLIENCVFEDFKIHSRPFFFPGGAPSVCVGRTSLQDHQMEARAPTKLAEFRKNTTF